MLISEIRNLLLKGAKLSELPMRVTFYGRVSTDMDEQLSSLEHQIQYFTNKIKENPRWEYVPGYIDEGISGTSVKKRKDFLRMIEDAKNGKFDLILTKEVSRFARDIVDSIHYTRKLLEYNVGVLFEDIGLNTIEPDAEFRLSIMATVAQEESRKISQRTKFGYKQAQLQGKRHGGAAPVGYVFNNENNGYSIDPEKSEMVRYVFNRYAENKVGLKQIAEELYHMGFKTKSGKVINHTAIANMIRHPVYTGHIVNGKSYVESYRDRKVTLKPRSEWILTHDENRVPPLVSQELWDKCNAILDKRSEYQKQVRDKVSNSKRTTRYAYSGKIKCVEHDCYYHRGMTTRRPCGRKEFYACPEYKLKGIRGCNAPRLRTEDLNQLMLKIFKYIGGEEQLESINQILSAIEQASRPDTLEQDIQLVTQQKDHIEAKKKKLINGWLEGFIDNNTYKETIESLETELEKVNKKLLDLKSTHLKAKNDADSLKMLYNDIVLLMQLDDKDENEIIENLVRNYLSEIHVYQVEDEPKKYRLDVYITGSETPIFGGTKQGREKIQINSELENVSFTDNTPACPDQKGLFLMRTIFTLPRTNKQRPCDKEVYVYYYLDIANKNK